MLSKFAVLGWSVASTFAFAAQEPQARPTPQARQTPQSKPASAPADAKLTAEERAKVVKMLRDAQAETLKAIDGLSDAQWTYKPAPDKWSVGECVEHIGLAEGALLEGIEKALASAPDPEWRLKQTTNADGMEKVLLNRSQKYKAPEPEVPTGKLTRAEATKRFKDARAKSLELAEKNQLPMKSYIPTEGPFAGMNAYLVLLVIPLHNLRHNQQIAEVKASAGFPAK